MDPKRCRPYIRSKPLQPTTINFDIQSISHHFTSIKHYLYTNIYSVVRWWLGSKCTGFNFFWASTMNKQRTDVSALLRFSSNVLNNTNNLKDSICKHPRNNEYIRCHCTNSNTLHKCLFPLTERKAN